jgi:hypothetical protein
MCYIELSEQHQGMVQVSQAVNKMYCEGVKLSTRRNCRQGVLRLNTLYSVSTRVLTSPRVP